MRCRLVSWLWSLRASCAASLLTFPTMSLHFFSPHSFVLDSLFSAVENFTVAARDFHERLQTLNRAECV